MDPQAIAHCRQALDLQQRLGDLAGAAHTWDSLGYAHHAARAAETAHAAWRHALDILDELGHPDGDRLRDRPRQLGGDSQRPR